MSLTFVLHRLCRAPVAVCSCYRVCLHPCAGRGSRRLVLRVACLASKQLRGACLPEIPLVLSCPELLLEPVDHVLEGVVVLVVEEVASGLDLDELPHQLFLRDVGHDDVLRILVEDCELVGDARGVLLLLLLDCMLKLLQVLAPQEFWVLYDLPKRTVARSDVPLDDLLQVVVGLVANPQLCADVCSDGLLLLGDIDVHDVAFVELPGESEMISSSRRWPEVKLAVVLLAQQTDSHCRGDVLESLVLDLSFLD